MSSILTSLSGLSVKEGIGVQALQDLDLFYIKQLAHGMKVRVVGQGVKVRVIGQGVKVRVIGQGV